MAHNLAVVNGRVAMAYQGDAPWHGLGTRFEPGLNIEQALVAANLNWDVALEPLFLKDGTELEHTRALVRDVDHVVIDTVSSMYQPIQNREAFGLFQPAIEKFGLQVETAGALGRGSKVWMLFKLPVRIEPVPGDFINGYGLAITGHDGMTINELRPTGVRVVCQNTFNMAVPTDIHGRSSVKGRIYGIPHIGDVKSGLEAAEKLVQEVFETMQKSNETFTAMAEKKLEAEQVKDFVEKVFPSPDKDKISDALALRRKEVSELIWTGIGAELAMSKTNGEPNPWACYNAVTAYFDHVYTAGAKTEAGLMRRRQSAIFGSGSEFKAKALKEARVLLAA